MNNSVENLLSEMINESKNILSPKEIEEVIHFMEHNESALAVDEMLWVLIQCQRPISQKIFDVIKDLYKIFNYPTPYIYGFNTPENMEKLSKLIK